jgi:hypothetical protein
MSDVKDFDVLLPEPVKIKLSGKIIDLYPGRVKALAKIQKAFNAFKDKPDDPELFEGVIDALSLIIPSLKDDDMDIALVQIPMLIELAYQVSVPTEAREVVTTEKKTDSSQP